MASAAASIKIALNMIVKNESKIITRLFDSVLPLIDTYCICDTGSTDNTVEIIEQYFAEKNIRGKIVREPFRDFAHNRTVALNACEDTDADWILLMDADMKLRIPENTDIARIKSKIAQHTAHYLFQGSDHFFYKNVRIVKNRHAKSYESVTHEYIQLPDTTTYGKFEKDELFIEDIGDGGSKADKFERDVRLLLKGLEDKPDNDRYTFYLASSYRDGGYTEEAIKYYKKRVDLGGWYEEIWYSYYAIGNCYQRLGNMESAIYYWVMAYNVIPKRMENLYKVVNHYRNLGKNELAYAYYRIADEQRKLLPQTPDFLFVENDVYDYKLDYELSIIGYYCNPHKYDLSKICMQILAKSSIEDWMTGNILSNYKFYSPKMANFAKNQCEYQPKISTEGFYSSTPSIVFYDNQFVVNIREVNYWINDQGGYDQRENIVTNNYLYRFPSIDAVFESAPDPKSRFFKNFTYNTTLDNLYVGVEDVRLFSYGGKLLYNGNRGLGYHTIVVEHGDVNLGISELLTVEKQAQIEKNWTLFEASNGEFRCVYHWYPLQIGEIRGSNIINKSTATRTGGVLNIQTAIETPEFFKQVRGSTNGVRVCDEVWFICHLVSYEDRRFYYHVIVVLDPVTYVVRRYSRLFTFEGEKVEYTLGFVYDEWRDSLTIGYSTMDRTTKFLEIARTEVEANIF